MAVILGYDESPGAVPALRVALELSVALAESLVLVYGAAAPGGPGDECRTHQEAVREAGHVALDHAVAAADAVGVPTTVEIIDQKPTQALLDSAARHGARFIVVGSWGESPARGALLGSTPLLHLLPVPVLCVPMET